jgi:hypothetical protein
VYVSRIFAANTAPGVPYMTSDVMVWPSAGYAARMQAAVSRPRGLHCVRSEAAQLLGGPGARVTVRLLPPAVKGGLWLRLKQTIVASRVRQTTYYDELSFARGPASIEVVGTSQGRPFSQRLLRDAMHILAARAAHCLPGSS